MEITREQFDQQRRPRFGKANPERMQLAFWEWMIRGGESPIPVVEGGLGKLHRMLRADDFISGDSDVSAYNAYRARKYFNVDLGSEDGPVWTFDRMGATCTELADGRVVCIAGEHEDFYDQDFYIYNDVVVFGPANQIEIYGYPKKVFPPTDFHTASLSGDRIIIVGSLGNPEARHPGRTPVYALDVSGYRISEIQTSGEMPGWIFKHNADLDAEGIITVRGGEVIEERGGRQLYRRNVEDYALDIKSRIWRRLTSRNWRQFEICRGDRRMLARERNPRSFVPPGIEPAPVPYEDWRRVGFLIAGVQVSMIVSLDHIEVIFEGDLPSDLIVRMAEEIRANAETVVGHACVVQEI